jgi:hypothetical protein
MIENLLAWQRLSMRMAETMVASSRVISHRTRRQNSHAQLFEMASEKVSASMESSQALARHWMRMSGRDPLACGTRGRTCSRAA